jgi:hypothetical protein
MVFLRVDRACSSVIAAVMARQGASGQTIDYDRASTGGTLAARLRAGAFSWPHGGISLGRVSERRFACSAPLR